MGFANVRDLVDACVAGQGTYYTFRKTPTTAIAGGWYDLSMSAGNPRAQYYAAAPLTAQTLSQSADGGLPHGGNVTGTKHLKCMTVVITTGAGGNLMLCDYLLFYPFCDDSTTDPQLMENTATLTRYTDGVGVQIMAVSVGARTGGQTFQVTYTNSDGVPGRLTQVAPQSTLSSNGTVINHRGAGTTHNGPFLALQQGDKGVRSIESVQMISGVDVGLFALVLVRPIVQGYVYQTAVPQEFDYFQHFGKLPEIKNDAYLGLLTFNTGTAVSNMNGSIETVWSN